MIDPMGDVECCYSPCCSDGDTPEEIEAQGGWVTCDGCGWSACSECADGNGWDASDQNGDSWCDDCLPEHST